MHTSDANRVSGPVSYLFALIQHIPNRRTPASITYRYAGGMALKRLKNRMTRHESRRLSPKVTGPSVPEANLRRTNVYSKSQVSAQLWEKAYARENIHIRGQPYEEYFDEMCFCPVFNGNRVDAYQRSRCGFGMAQKHSLIRVDQVLTPIDTHPAPPLPRPRASWQEDELSCR